MRPFRNSFRLLRAGVLGTVLAATGAAPTLAAGPVDSIKAFYDVLLDVMKNADTLKFEGRHAKVAPAVRQTFDLALMTRLTVGPEWKNFSADQQQRLVAAFSEYTISTYAARFDGYSGEKFVVDPAPNATPNGTIVKSNLVKSNGEPIALNYLMRESDGDAKVFDIFLSGTISELAARRSEFSAVLRRDGADGLVKLLEQRAAEQRKG